MTAYNNTIINAGWRRDGEKRRQRLCRKENVLANVFNNMMVNCKYRAQVPSWDDPNNTDGGFDTKSVIDYNCYVGHDGNRLYIDSWDDDGETVQGQGIHFAWQGYQYDHEDYHMEAARHKSNRKTAPSLPSPCPPWTATA